MKNNKYSIVCEGKTEKYLFRELKTTIFKNKKIHQCKKHKSKILKGTISSNDYVNGNKCCVVFYIIDVDHLDKNQIWNHCRNIENKNGILIISKPCLEIILLSIFENNLNIETITKDDIYQRLTKALIEKKIINKDEKYSKTNNSSLIKLLKFLQEHHDYIDG